MTDGTVLLAMDFQNGIAGGLAEAPIMDRVRDALAHARETGIPVVWVRVALRPGYPELPETSPFQRIAALGDLSEDSDSTQILEVLGRREDEPLVTKRRVGAFSGSDLATVLAGLGATNLVLTGVATRGVVLATGGRPRTSTSASRCSPMPAPIPTLRSTACSPRRSSRGSPTSSPSPNGPRSDVLSHRDHHFAPRPTLLGVGLGAKCPSRRGEGLSGRSCPRRRPRRGQ